MKRVEEMRSAFIFRNIVMTRDPSRDPEFDKIVNELNVLVARLSHEVRFAMRLKFARSHIHWPRSLTHSPE